jgi:hypothetical protein
LPEDARSDWTRLEWTSVTARETSESQGGLDSLLQSHEVALVNPKQLACLLAFCLSASALVAHHHYDTEDNVPRTVLATLTSKDGIVIQWLHVNTQDPRWRYWVNIKNTDPYRVVVRLADGTDFPVAAKGESGWATSSSERPDVVIASVTRK